MFSLAVGKWYDFHEFAMVYGECRLTCVQMEVR